MKNLTFEWDENNEDKLIERHGVMPEEAEECFYNRRVIKKAGKNIYYLYGQTDTGRYLFLVFELKGTSTARIYSGRNMISDERSQFKRMKK
jgi:uncharacterized protein